MNLKPHLESKTNGALIILLLAIIGLAIIGKLTQEAVDALKWVGGSFFMVRGVANFNDNSQRVEVGVDIKQGDKYNVTK